MLCRSRSVFRSHPDEHARRKIHKLRVYCSHRRRGCEWVGELSDMDRHVESCPRKNSPLETKQSGPSTGTYTYEYVGLQHLITTYPGSHIDQCREKSPPMNVLKWLQLWTQIPPSLVTHMAGGTVGLVRPWPDLLFAESPSPFFHAKPGNKCRSCTW